MHGNSLAILLKNCLIDLQGFGVNVRDKVGFLLAHLALPLSGTDHVRCNQRLEATNFNNLI